MTFLYTMRMNKQTLLIVGVLVLVVGGIIALAVATTPNIGVLPEVSKVETGDQVTGKADAAVVLVEYSDFQCPACATYFPIVKEVVDAYKDRIAFVYRHFPLPQHTKAMPAARAAEAAGYQEKFWEMHDMLFEKQTEWGNASDPKAFFKQYAQTLGLDAAKFETDMNGSETNTEVRRDYQSGAKASVSSTPTFFLNGERLNVNPTVDAFKAELDKALAATE